MTIDPTNQVNKRSFLQKIADFWKKGTREKIVLLIVSGFLLCYCLMALPLGRGSGTSDAPTQNLNAVETNAFQTAWAPFTQTALASTATPSQTPLPTETPLPTPTNTPPPEPILLTGSGDSIVDVAKWNEPAIMRAKYSSGGNFIVQNYDANNQQIELLINTIGSYEGTVPLDFLIGEMTARFEVKASGPWEIQILPLTQMRHAAIPGNIQGIGDDVIYLDGANADLINANANTAQGNFIVFSYSKSGVDLIFNEIAPYAGTALLNGSTFMISIKTEGNWSLDVTTK